MPPPVRAVSAADGYVAWQAGDHGQPGDIWESERLVVTVGTLTVGDNPDERCVVVYRRRADSSLAILVDAPIRESRR